MEEKALVVRFTVAELYEKEDLVIIDINDNEIDLTNVSMETIRENFMKGDWEIAAYACEPSVTVEKNVVTEVIDSPDIGDWHSEEVTEELDWMNE